MHKLGIFCTGSCGVWDSVSKLGIFCTGISRGRQFGVKKSVFLHRKLWSGRFGARKSVFLHQKSSPAENSAQIGHFLHRKLWRSSACGIWCHIVGIKKFNIFKLLHISELSMSTHTGQQYLLFYNYLNM